eukprot:5540612-Alexandrium_andersonii.AAC.1
MPGGAGKRCAGKRCAAPGCARLCQVVLGRAGWHRAAMGSAGRLCQDGLRWSWGGMGGAGHQW